MPKFGNNFLIGCNTGSVTKNRTLLRGSSPLGKIQDNITLPNIAIVNNVMMRSKAGFNAAIYLCISPKVWYLV